MQRRHPLEALVVDLDGVVTDTASLHARAWKETFDEYLARRATRAGEEHRPFTQGDYEAYIDGRPRYDGARSFLESRGIGLPFGDPGDTPEAETVCAIGNRKDVRFHELLREVGVEVYPSSVAFLRSARRRGMRTAMMTSSRNGREVMAAARVTGLFDAVLDGTDADALGLPGKPDPAMFVEAARRVGADPSSAGVLEDAVAGVVAGRRGGFGLVVGIDRTGHREELKRAGADIVVDDLGDLADVRTTCRLPVAGEATVPELPSALEGWDTVAARLRQAPVAVFLDYDGTLTPIVERPERAVLSVSMRETVATLASRVTVAVLSGRDARDVRERVGVPGVYCAGSHGFEILGPGGERLATDRDAEFDAYLTDLDAAERRLREVTAGIPGALVERKRYGVAAHYRLVAEGDVDRLVRAVRDVAGQDGRLRLTSGKKVLELRPDVAWDKGEALLHVLRVTVGEAPAVPVFLGDDVTDEDAFQAIRDGGLGIVVGTRRRRTAAAYRLDDVDQVRVFLQRLAAFEEAR